MSLRVATVLLNDGLAVTGREVSRANGALFDTDSQTLLPLLLDSPTLAVHFLAAIERSGISLGYYTPLVELRAAFMLWHDAHERKD